MDQKQLWHNFIQYLKDNYHYARPETMASNVFYVSHHDIGMDFCEIFQSETSMQRAKELLIKKFEEIGRKYPQGHAEVHYGCWKKFKEFMDAESQEHPPEAFDLAGILDTLCKKRCLFHSEADFQFALAWEIQAKYPAANVRLKYCRKHAPTMHIDILAELDGQIYPIELKYKTFELETQIGEESYHLKSHGAQDIRKYDCLIDLQRLEQYSSLFERFSCGFAVWLTNDPLYWSAPKHAGTMAEAFSLAEGTCKTGTMQWAPHMGEGTSRNRTDMICLYGSYSIHWREYSEISGGRGAIFAVL